MKVLECKTHLLRILAERQAHSELQALELDVLRILEIKSIPLAAQSHAHYVIGICWHYREIHDLEVAMSHFEKAIELALASGDRQPLAFAMYGKIATLYSKGLFEKVAASLQKLDSILEVLPIPELECSCPHRS